MQPKIVAKNQFAAKVWKSDAHVARQVSLFFFQTTQLRLLTLMLWSASTKGRPPNIFLEIIAML
jgi:hypothetical protein